MKTLAVINPRSAGGRTRREADTIARRLAEVSGPLSVALTEGPLDASRITSRGLLEGFERIVAVGGDGTINEVVNGFFHEGAVINPEAELCLLNMGTGGDFRKTFEIGIGLDAALQRMTEGPLRRIDAGCLTYVAPDGRTGTRYFANIASFGLSGDVVERVNSARLLKRVTGQFAYTWASLSALVRFRPKPVRLKVDDVFDDVVTISTCAVCNGQYFGGGMKVAPGASPDDGLFDVVVMGAAPLKQTLSSMNDIFTGEHVNNPNVRVLRGRRVIATPVEATEGAPIHIEADGESPGRLPAMFEVRARALKFRG